MVREPGDRPVTTSREGIVPWYVRARPRSSAGCSPRFRRPCAREQNVGAGERRPVVSETRTVTSRPTPRRTRAGTRQLHARHAGCDGDVSRLIGPAPPRWRWLSAEARFSVFAGVEPLATLGRSIRAGAAARATHGRAGLGARGSQRPETPRAPGLRRGSPVTGAVLAWPHSRGLPRDLA